MAHVFHGYTVPMDDSAEQGIATSEALLRALLDGAGDAIYLKDQAGCYLFVNVAGARFVGKLPASVIGKTDLELFHSEDARLIRAIDETVLSTGQPRVFYETLTAVDRERIMYTTKTPLLNPAGEVVGVIGISRDCTEERGRELMGARLAAILESSPDAAVGSTPGGLISTWNAGATRVFGYTREEAIDAPLSMLVPPDRQAELVELRDRVKRGEWIANHETVRVRKDGTRIDVALSLSPVFDASGHVSGVAAIARDISAQKRMEKDLREGEERLRLAVEAAHLGVWSWDLKKDRLLWTPPCKSMHGLAPDDEVSVEALLGILDPADREAVQREIQRTLHDGPEYRAAYRVHWRDGTLHWISASGRVLLDEAGARYCMVGVAVDITAQRQAEQERNELLLREQAARAEAQAATRAKDDFLAVLSHELRAPLQSMLGWTRILKAPDVDAETARKGMDVIERNIKLQARLVEDVLDVSRIASGKLDLALQPVDLEAVVASALASAKACADARGVQLNAMLEPLSGDVLGDALRLEQIVTNLLSNAVKFTPKGGRVDLRLEREGAAAKITVEDTGAGIPAEFLPHVFERFRQADGTRTRSHGGLGLGLAIVRTLVELHGGAVVAESAGERRGARFTVRLPLIAGERRAVAGPSGELRSGESGLPLRLDGVRVVMVEDDLDTCELLETVLRAIGAEVRSASSVRDGLAAIEAFHPDVVLSDIGMPGEDGHALVRQVRAQEAGAGTRLPAVALTAFTSEADRARTSASGFDAHLAKPVSLDLLVTTLARLAGKAA